MHVTFTAECGERGQCRTAAFRMGVGPVADVAPIPSPTCTALQTSPLPVCLKTLQFQIVPVST